MNIDDKDKPITPAKAQNKIWRVDSFILATPTFKAMMNPKGANIKINPSDEPKIALPTEVYELVLKSNAKDAVKWAIAPVKTNPTAIKE
jgi:hypothetical protein